MRDESRRSAWATNTLHSRAFSPPLSHGVPPIFLTALLAYGAVASRLGLCEELLHYGKLATGSQDQHLCDTFIFCTLWGGLPQRLWYDGSLTTPATGQRGRPGALRVSRTRGRRR